MKTLNRTFLTVTLSAVSLQAIVAAINWNLTKDWPQYKVETSSTAHHGG